MVFPFKSSEIFTWKCTDSGNGKPNAMVEEIVLAEDLHWSLVKENQD
jgi:hypothetical protein